MPWFVREGIIMKRLFVLLLFLLVPFAPIGAQGLHGKILMVRDTSSYVPQDMANEVPSIYHGQIDSSFQLPTDLSGYDALLIQFHFPDGENDTLTASEKLTLIDYVKTGGKLYLENPSFRFLASSDKPNNPDLPEDTLWHFLGLSSEGGDALVARYSAFWGVDSEFTKGLNVPHDAGVPTEDDLLGSYIPFGNFIPVLYGTWVGGDIFAWIPSDTSIHTVVQFHPVFDYGHKSEYYVPFLTRVLCDYFGLCVDAVKEAPPAVPPATLQVQNDGFSTSCIISIDESGTLDIANALGITVYHSSVNFGTSHIELPETLRNGVYFARLQTEHGGQVQPFAIVGR
jgi:hypothetical protein